MINGYAVNPSPNNAVYQTTVGFLDTSQMQRSVGNTPRSQPEVNNAWRLSRWSCPCMCHKRLKQACNMCGDSAVLDNSTDRGWQ